LFVIDANDADEDTVMEIALEAGADDFSRIEDSFEIICPVDAFQAIKTALNTDFRER